MTLSELQGHLPVASLFKSLLYDSTSSLTSDLNGLQRYAILML